MVFSVCRWFKAAFLAAGIVSLAAANLQAGSITINPGYDEMKTQTAYFNNLPFTTNPLNTYAFPGITPSPSDVGATDTIIQRTGSALTFTNDGDHGTMDITVKAISLKSETDINIGYGVHTYYSSVDPTLNPNDSPGGPTSTITITYNGTDGGTWTNNFWVWVDLHQDSPTGHVDATVLKHFTGNGTWATTPGPWNPGTIIPGVNQDNNFWITGPAYHDAGGGTVHVVESIQSVPEPSSVALLLSGATMVGYFAIRRKKA